MDGEHWSKEFQHPSITDENRETFNTHMNKFTTREDAIVDGFGLAKLKGKPFKLPGSMADLPDDTARGELTTQAQKLLGIVHAANIEELSGVDLKVGMAEGASYDEDFAKTFLQFAVDKKIPKSVLPSIAEFFNLAAGKITNAQRDSMVAAIEETNKTLAAHSDFGSKEKLDEASVLTHRALMNNMGLSTDEANDIAGFLKSREGATNATLRRILIKSLAPLAASSSNESGGDGHKPDVPTDLAEGTPSYQAIGWSAKTGQAK